MQKAPSTMPSSPPLYLLSKINKASLGVAAAETVGIASHSAHPFGDNGGGGASIANRIRLSSSSSFPASILSVSRYLIFFLSGLGGLEQ